MADNSALVIMNGQRMLWASRAYFEGSAVLSEVDVETGNSAAILRILAMEIALKALRLLIEKKRPRGHDYLALWTPLPADLKKDMLAAAELAGSQVGMFKDIDDLLNDWRKVFENGRYDFEVVDQMTLAQEGFAAEKWIANGALDADADFRFHPFELTVFVETLHKTVEDKIETA